MQRLDEPASVSVGWAKFVNTRTKYGDHMSFLLRIWRSSLGKKYIMALSGFALSIFIVLHLVGNLMVFLGPEGVNAYGNFLQSVPELLWPARTFLILVVILHFTSAAKLTLENLGSRPTAYSEYDVVAANYAARTMIVSGFIVLFFLIYHLLHFTIEAPAINLSSEDFRTFTTLNGQHDIYRMVIVGFQQPIVSAFYVLGIGLLCAHLSHGLSSMFQSMGWKNKFYGKFLDPFAIVAAVVIFLGYCSIPAAVLAGVLKLQ